LSPLNKDGHLKNVGKEGFGSQLEIWVQAQIPRITSHTWVSEGDKEVPRPWPNAPPKVRVQARKDEDDGYRLHARSEVHGAMCGSPRFKVSYWPSLS
jgi:hypothetical protein